MRRHPAIALLVVVPILAFLAGCGTSGGNDASDDAKTTTTASADEPTTDTADDEPVDDETTTTPAEDDDPGDGPSASALVDLLPTADEIGPGYTVSDENLGDDNDDDSSSDDDESDDPDPLEQAMIDQCPGAEFLDELDDGGSSPTEVSREFENEAEATVEVSLDPSPAKFDEDTVGKIVEALSDCGPIEATDDDAQIKMTISAEELEDFGDFGLTMTMEAEYTTMGSTIPIEFHGMIFSVDGTAVSVIATSGLDPETYELVDGDYDILPDLAATMEERVGSL